MIIDSPIISGSYAASGSLNQFGNVVISGSLTVTGSIIGTASFAATASYLSGYVSPFPFTGSAIISGSLEVTGSANIPSITGSLLGTASFANTATSSSFATTASFSLNVPVTSSYANNATSASFATTASYLTGYISPFPFTGSAIISGSLIVTGSVAVSNLSGSGVRYLVADPSGSITAQSASAALKSTEAFVSTAGQTTFSVTNGYSTGYVDVFINGSKLSTAEFTDTSGTNIVLATGSFSGDTVEVVKYTPAAGVTNNVLRQLTTLTGSAGQTVFSASYTPGLLDIFYNGSRLSPSDFTANNGTYFTLATGSAANDILDVLVYSYQVGAFSGIGGVGTADQIAYFGTTNSITGSPNFTISGSTMTVTGSLTVSGSGTFTNIGPAVMSGSLNISGSLIVGGSNVVLSNQTSSLNVSTASFAATASSADNLLVRNTLTAQTLVVQTITSSVDFVTGSTRFGSILGNTHVFSGSVTMNPGGLFVSSSSIVGIGTTSPNTKLQVEDGFISTYHNINSDGAGYGIQFYTNGGGSKNTIANIEISQGGTARSGNIIFSTSNSGAPIERMRITNSGSVGIGTDAPSERLHLNSSNTNAAFIRFQNISGSGVYIGGRNNDMELYAGGAERMKISGSGNVGIGTSSPSAKLDVRGGSDGDAMISIGSPTVSGILNSPSNIYINADSDNDSAGGIIALGFNKTGYTGGTEAMRVLENGNVGIGTNSPNVSGQGANQRVLTVQGTGGVWGGVEVGLTNNTSAGALNGFYGFTNASLSAGYNLVSYIGSWLDGGGVTSGADMRFHTQPNGAASPVERMRISSAGYITKPYNPAFRAYYSVNSTWTLAQNDTFVFNATEYNIGSGYNTSNGRFTAPVAGVYQFNFYSIVYGAITNGFINLQKNSAQLTSGTNLHFTTTAAATWTNVQFITSVYLNSGDYVSLINRDMSVNYHGRDWSSFSGYLVG